jgi:hypothetical protein
MATLQDPVDAAVAALVGKDDSPYYGSPWTDQRGEYAELKSWYDGEEWRRKSQTDDPITGGKELQWPLQINPIAKVCRVHRAVMLGMQPDVVSGPSGPVISTVVSRENLDETRKQYAETLEEFLSSIWLHSNGSAILTEAALLAQIYGGHVLRVTWEGWNKLLPYRMAVRSFRNPGEFFAAVVNPTDLWDLIECYIGYMIEPDVAYNLYGIRTDKKKVLYLEHWTKETYKYTVDDRVPVLEHPSGKQRLEGENRWGVIPIVYIPHERDGKYLGRSLINGDSPLIGLAKEINARQADKGEALQGARSLISAKNIRQQGLLVKQVIVNGRVVDILDIGDASRIPGSPEPEAKVLEPQGVPQSVSGFPSEMWAETRRQADVAAVAFGDDDVSGGRITGPVTAYRMWPTMQHTMTERIFFSTGLAQIARIITIIGLDKLQKSSESGFEKYGALVPQLTDEMLAFDIGTSWRPMIPLEVTQKAEMLDDQLRVGGVSLITYLRERGVQDPEAEAERIWQDRERQAKIEASVQIEVAQEQAKVTRARSQNSGQNTV